MNKRPLGPTGLPAKPGNPGVPHHQPGGYAGTPGPAPPLPPGPMPQQYPQHQQQQQQQQYPQQGYAQQQQHPQQQQQQQGQQGQAQVVDPVAHAAAWAAYYQATGQPNPYAQSQPTIGASPNTANPAAASGPTSYANYGYGAGASHANHLNPGAAPVQQNANAQGAPGYGAYQYPQQPQQRGTGYPPQGPGQAPGYGYNGQQPQQAQAVAPQAYRPLIQPQQGGYGYNSPAGPSYPGQSPYPQQPQQQQQQQQTYYPQPTPPPHQQQQGFRPGGMNPSPVRPYQPRPPGPPGPGMGMSPSHSPNMPMGGQGCVPPAKRPRFDRPDMNPPARINNGQPGFNYQPGYAPQGGSGPSGPIHIGANMGSVRPPAPLPAAPPIVRPPIHLGMGGPPPPGIIAPRGPAFNRGGGRGGRGGAVHVPGAPRGPAGMSGLGTRGRPTPVVFGSTRRGGGGYAGVDREREERERERERRREKERGPGTTMTDFRIVGIQIRREGEMAEEGGEKMEEWKWGWVEDEATAQHPKAEDEVESGEKGVEAEVKVEEGTAKVENGDAGDVQSSSETKAETEPNGSHEAEEKRGEKRKAKTPDGEEEPEGSSKKRAAHAAATEPISDSTNSPEQAQASSTTESQPPAESDVTVKTEPDTNKADRPLPLPPKPDDGTAESNTATTDTPAPAAEAELRSRFEEPQNRFRIYFESPPELDRIPKAIRRGSNKRWRRESSSVAPAPVPVSASVVGEEASDPPAAEAVEGEVEVKTNADTAVEVEALAAPDQTLEAQEGEKAENQVAVPNGTEDSTAVAAESTPIPVVSKGTPVEGAVTAETTAAETGVDQTVLPQGDEVEVGDVSMRSSAADLEKLLEEPDAAEEAVDALLASLEGKPVEILGQPGVQDVSVPVVIVEPTSPVVETAESTDAAPAASTENTRTRRQTSISTHDEHDHEHDEHDGDAASAIDSAHEHAETAPASVVGASTSAGPLPSVNRLSILYEESSRRICVDAEAVESVRVFRAQGKIEISLKADKAGGEGDVEEKESSEGELRKGVLMEMYDSSDERFVCLSAARLAEIYPTSDPSPTNDSESIPPLHHSGPMIITLWLNRKRPLSEPKWCRTNSADEWLFETFTNRRFSSSDSDSGWRGKLQVVDPDPAPTLASILSSWATGAMSGTLDDRQSFVSSLTATNDPADLLEILLRLARGDRNPTLGGGGYGGSGGQFGNLAGAIRPDSPFASHQTHVSLAVLQLYRLTMVYADKAGEGEAVREKVEDIVRSLPVGMIQRSLDGLFREWTDKRVSVTKQEK